MTRKDYNLYYEEPPFKIKVLWELLRASMILWAIYGVLHGSWVEFHEGFWAMMITHLWDFFRIFAFRGFMAKGSYKTSTAFIIFVAFCVIVGSTFNNRTEFAHIDVITHFISGFLTTWFGYELAVLIQNSTSRHYLSPGLAGLFAFCFGEAFTAAWEIYEYIIDHFYGLSLQNSFPTNDYGLQDTMKDIIVGSLGAVLGCVITSLIKNGYIGRNKEKYKKFKMNNLELKYIESSEKSIDKSMD